MADYAGENNVSLIGIINYEIAKYVNRESQEFDFYIPFGRGKFGVQDIDAHTEHIENTIRYLNKYNLNFTTSDYTEPQPGPGVGSPERYYGKLFHIKIPE